MPTTNLSEIFSMATAITHASKLLPTTTSIATSNATGNAQTNTVVFDTFLKCVCLSILTIGTVGNLVVILTFGIKWSRLKTCEIFMINLAMADLVGTACLPTITFFELQKITFAPLGDIGCQWLYAFNLSSLTVSAFTLVCIAADRFIIVRYPFRRKPHKLKIIAISLSTWALSFFFGAVYLFDNVRIVDGESHASCRSHMTQTSMHVHNVVVFCFQVILPMTVMAVLYSLILKSLRFNQSKVLTENNRIMEVRLKQNKRTTRLFLTVVFTFYFLILPHNLFMMVYTFNVENIDGTTAFYGYYTTLMLHMVNSSVNPLIYARMHYSFRGAAISLLCCRSGSWTHAAWRGITQTRRRLSSSFSKSTTISSRLTTINDGRRSVQHRPCPSPDTDSYVFAGTPRTEERLSALLLKDTYANEKEGEQEVGLLSVRQSPRARLSFDCPSDDNGL